MNSAIDSFLNPRRRKRVLISAIVWFFVCLFYSAPASLFEALLRKAVPQLQMQNVSGSFWNGSATQSFWQQNNQVIALGSLEWHLQPLSLLWLHPTLHAMTNYGEQFIDARVRVSPLGHLVLTKTSAALPAALLSSFAPVPARGQLALKLERAELSHDKVNALDGALYWQQAQWPWGARWLALGDYRCELKIPAPGQIHCAVQGQGALGVDGNIDIDTAARHWAAQARFTFATSLPDEFRQSLQLMLAAQPDAQGRLSVKRNGRW